MKIWFLLGLCFLMAACSAEKEVETTTLVSGGEVEVRSAPLGVDSGFYNDSAALVAATGRPQLLEFYTDWCPTCKSMKPTVHALEAEYWGKVDFVYLDRENAANREWVNSFNVRGQPVFVLIEADGTLINQWYGGVSGETLTAAIDGYLAQAGR